MPAGKAMALAAMPTAVLMGMGLTPTLAQAKGGPKNPFQAGPCVTQPDAAPEEDEKKDDAKSGGDATDPKGDTGKDGQDASEPGSGDSGADKPADGSEEDGKPAADPLKPLREAADKAKEAADKAVADAKKAVEKANASVPGAPDEAEPSPEPTEDGGIDWDPLGFGDWLKDLFTPDDEKSEPSESEPSEDVKVPIGGDKELFEDAKKALGDADKKKSAATEAKKAFDDAAKKAGKAVEDAKKGVEDTADKAKDAVDKAKPDVMAPDEDGKKPFPCPVEKKVAGEDEQAPVLLPKSSWGLEASSLTLKGADYKGIVNVPVAGGGTKQVMKYIISDGVDIGDLHQTVDDETSESGKILHVRSDKGSKSTIRNGPTVMYTESLSGKLFGLIPITFDPEHPPPLNIPFIHFTDVKVVQAGQFGGDLTIPGIDVSFENK